MFRTADHLFIEYDVSYDVVLERFRRQHECGRSGRERILAAAAWREIVRRAWERLDQQVALRQRLDEAVKRLQSAVAQIPAPPPEFRAQTFKIILDKARDWAGAKTDRSGFLGACRVVARDVLVEAQEIFLGRISRLRNAHLLVEWLGRGLPFLQRCGRQMAFLNRRAEGFFGAAKVDGRNHP